MRPEVFLTIAPSRSEWGWASEGPDPGEGRSYADSDFHLRSPRRAGAKTVMLLLMPLTEARPVGDRVAQLAQTKRCFTTCCPAGDRAQSRNAATSPLGVPLITMCSGRVIGQAAFSTVAFRARRPTV